jgi:adenine phosphoribosyltransferase
MDLKKLIRTVPDFPKKGIMFRDITCLLKDPQGFKYTVDLFAQRYKDSDIDIIAGIESRGFILGSALAYRLEKGFVPVRKQGKLPAKSISQEYDLEYGKDVLEIHVDALEEGQKVLLIDDLMATGGTAIGAAQLIEKLGAVVTEFAVVIDLPELGGTKKLQNKGISFFRLLEFEGE